MENEKEFEQSGQKGLPDDYVVGTSADLSGTEAAALNDATVVVAAAESELGSGVGEAVIDRDEWNKIVADVDAKQAEAAEKEKKVKEDAKKK